MMIEQAKPLGHISQYHLLKYMTHMFSVLYKGSGSAKMRNSVSEMLSNNANTAKSTFPKMFRGVEEATWDEFGGYAKHVGCDQAVFLKYLVLHHQERVEAMEPEELKESFNSFMAE